MNQTQRPTLSSDRIQDALYGFARSQMLFTAIDLDIFTQIGEGCALACLCERLDTDPRAMRIFLDGLVGIGFLEKSAGQYILPDDVKAFLTHQSPFYLGGMVNHCKGLYENWMLLTDVVKSGQPAGGAQILADLEAYFSELVKGLYVSNMPTAQKLAETLGMGTARKGLSVLDVAGGSAVWSISLLEADINSRATVLDYPSVIDVAKGFVARHGLESRFDYLPGDLEEMTFPDEQFDLAILGNICHAIGPNAVEKLFQNVSHALKPGGTLAVVDFVPDNDRAQTGWPLLFGVNMLISTPEGNVFTQQEYQSWLTQAGFGTMCADSLESEITLITAQKQ